MIHKGILLAGGAGTRLYPLNLVGSKQLQPVYDKPMIYYPLTTLMLGGVREICLISTPRDLPRFRELLGDGAQWGLSITYVEQVRPEGIAQAFLLARDFIADEPVSLILGDNIFHGPRLPFDIFRTFQDGAFIFAYRVSDPERYGVIEFDETGRAVSLEEKPAAPRSRYAIPGLYLYDADVVGICENLRPSARGELEITDVNRVYLEQGRLQVHPLGRGTAWLDTGNPISLQEASEFIAIIERRQGTKIGCPEEAALRTGLINPEAFRALLHELPDCQYADYLRSVLDDALPLLGD